MAGFWSKLFGGGGGAAAPAQSDPPVTYEGYAIQPEPVNQGGQWRLGARITRDVDGETRTHVLIRADTVSSRDQAVEASIAKARLMIDQQGDGIFG